MTPASIISVIKVLPSPDRPCTSNVGEGKCRFLTSQGLGNLSHTHSWNISRQDICDNDRNELIFFSQMQMAVAQQRQQQRQTASLQPQQQYAQQQQQHWQQRQQQQQQHYNPAAMAASPTGGQQNQFMLGHRYEYNSIVFFSIIPYFCVVLVFPGREIISYLYKIVTFSY